MKTTELLRALDAVAPLVLAEPWDNTGLILDAPERASGDAAADRVLLTIDLTDAVVDEALRREVGFVVSYHPPVFHPIRRLTTAPGEAGPIVRLAWSGIGVLSPHTALDAASGGVADWLLDQAVGDDEAPNARRAVKPHEWGEAAQTHKLVVFVPEADADGVSRALAGAGAGRIGEYSECSFRGSGEGRFVAGAASNPAIGARGTLERVAETRLEMVCPGSRLAEVLAALRSVHPYEEPAFDVFRREASSSLGVGVGRMCSLKAPVRAQRVAARVASNLGVERVRLAADAEQSVRTVAVCPGSGGSLLREAAVFRGCGVDPRETLFVTGEMSHHEVLAARREGFAVVLGGHTRTERGYLPVLRGKLLEALASSAGAASPDIGISEADGWPFVEASGGS